MQTTARIPSLPSTSHFAMNKWFRQMHQAGLLYHPDERAENIVNIKSGAQMFDSVECDLLDTLMDQMFEVHGDMVYKVCLKHFKKVIAIRPK
jgi:arginyl-tRNA--protein-N-Asp/Glu arginylyltransferase